jgi:predicted nucleotide-binding protein
VLESPAMAKVEEAITALDKLLAEAQDLSKEYRAPLFEERLERWSKRAEAKLREWGGLLDEARRFGDARGDENLRRQEYYYSLLQARQRVLAALREDFAEHPDFYTEKPKPAPPEPSQPPADLVAKRNKVFLGHGKNLLWSKVERWLEKDKGVLVEAWESKSRAGEQVVQVLERLLDSCTFAVLVVIGEDATATNTLRARQNVVHEIGLFQGKLGFTKVALLQQEGTESFSNVDGLQAIRFPGDRIEAAFPELERMMKREGLIQ